MIWTIPFRTCDFSLVPQGTCRKCCIVKDFPNKLTRPKATWYANMVIKSCENIHIPALCVFSHLFSNCGVYLNWILVPFIFAVSLNSCLIDMNRHWYKLLQPTVHISCYCERGEIFIVAIETAVTTVWTFRWGDRQQQDTTFSCLSLISKCGRMRKKKLRYI